LLIAYYFMWHTGKPAPEQCEGCTWVTSQVRELSYIHARDVTFAVFCQGPYEESARYRHFMGWEMPWYSAQVSLDTLLVGRQVNRMYIVCYLRQGSKVFETYWTTIRGQTSGGPEDGGINTQHPADGWRTGVRAVDWRASTMERG
jgi:predicted dithiol-disulfide oxidoreductase (DUF899 family)